MHAADKAEGQVRFLLVGLLKISLRGSGLRETPQGCLPHVVRQHGGSPQASSVAGRMETVPAGENPAPPTNLAEVAQMAERLTCNQERAGSMPVLGSIWV